MRKINHFYSRKYILRGPNVSNSKYLVDDKFGSEIWIYFLHYSIIHELSDDKTI